MILLILSIPAAYILGSVPTAYIFAKFIKGVDIRDHGSGNVGATNAFRTIGRVPGIAVLVLDFLKGFAAVTVIPAILSKHIPDLDMSYGFIYIALGAAVISGHIWTIFLRFKGGKGVATTAGVMAGIAPVLLLCSLGVWIAVFWVWKYVSLASILAATSLPVFSAIMGKPFEITLFTSILCVVGVISHRSNIRRLVQGRESKLLGNKKA